MCPIQLARKEYISREENDARKLLLSDELREAVVFTMLAGAQISRACSGAHWICLSLAETLAKCAPMPCFIFGLSSVPLLFCRYREALSNEFLIEKVIAETAEPGEKQSNNSCVNLSQIRDTHQFM